MAPWHLFDRFIHQSMSVKEPLTSLMRLAESLEFAYLLDRADATEDPAEQQGLVTDWFLAQYFSHDRPYKPFASFLGETFQLKLDNGIEFIAEQVSRHGDGRRDRNCVS